VTVQDDDPKLLHEQLWGKGSQFDVGTVELEGVDIEHIEYNDIDWMPTPLATTTLGLQKESIDSFCGIHVIFRYFGSSR